MPDTYRFERGMERTQIIQAMMRAQERELARIWDRRADDLPIETPEELVIPRLYRREGDWSCR